VDEIAFGIHALKCRILNKMTETSPDMVDKTVKCICISYNTVIYREGLHVTHLRIRKFSKFIKSQTQSS
jgi:hypothetical protein